MNAKLEEIKYASMRLMFYLLGGICVFLGKFRKNNNRLLIIRIDAIGDYILFRNFLEIIKQNYSNYDITLLGNSLWQPIAEGKDRNYIDNFIWIDNPNELKSKFIKLLKIASVIFTNNYSIVISPAHSRIFATNTLVAFSGAKKRIGVKSNNLRESKGLFYALANKYYTDLIDIPKDIVFVLEKNRYLFHHLTGIDCSHIYISIEDNSEQIEKGNYVLIGLGAGASYRKWAIENVSQIVKCLLESYNYKILLVGGLSDQQEARIITDCLNNSPIVDYTGKTTLPELINLVKHATVVLGNDTGVIHLAAALDTPAVCVVGGGHFNVFVPYPNYSNKNTPRPVSYKMDCFGCDWQCVYNQNHTRKTVPCIEKIEVLEVWSALDAVISKLMNK